MLNTIDEIMRSLPSMSAGYVRPVSPEFIDEILCEDAISAFEAYDDPDEDEHPSFDAAPASVGCNVYVDDAFSLDPDEFPYALVDRDHAKLVIELTPDDFDYDELTPHPHEHPSKDNRHFHGKSTKVRRQEYKWYESSRKERECSTPVRRYQRSLRKWEAQLASAGEMDAYINRFGWVVFPVPGVTSMPPAWHDVLDTDEPVTDDENFVNDMSFADYDDMVEDSIHGGAIVRERVCCGYDHGSNYHEAMDRPTGRMLHDRAEEFEDSIHDEWWHMLPAWSRWIGDAEHIKEWFYDYSRWLSRLQYLVITGTLPLNKYTDDADPHLFGDCNCCRYWFPCEYEHPDAPTLNDELGDCESTTDTQDEPAQYLWELGIRGDCLDMFVLASQEIEDESYDNINEGSRLS